MSEGHKTNGTPSELGEFENGALILSHSMMQLTLSLWLRPPTVAVERIRRQMHHADLVTLSASSSGVTN